MSMPDHGKRSRPQAQIASLIAMCTLLVSAGFAQGKAAGVAGASEPAGKFVDVTDKAGIHFLHQAPHTSRKYLIETMGSGVGLFDCDNDGRLDIFLVNGAPY